MSKYLFKSSLNPIVSILLGPFVRFVSKKLKNRCEWRLNMRVTLDPSEYSRIVTKLQCDSRQQFQEFSKARTCLFTWIMIFHYFPMRQLRTKILNLKILNTLVVISKSKGFTLILHSCGTALSNSPIIS